MVPAVAPANIPPCPGAPPASPARDPSPPVGATASGLALAGLLGAAGVVHFVIPDQYATIVPRVLPAEWARPLVHLTGAMEIAAALLLAVPRTRRVGALAAAALLVAVFPANVQMALDGGVVGSGFPLGSPVVAWLRVPAQAPLVLWALSIARPRTRREAPQT